jgi:hypothetical protein
VENVLMRWLGGPPPSLWSLLVVCSQMGISPLQHTRIDPMVIRHALEAVLGSNQPPPPSMRLVADRL